MSLRERTGVRDLSYSHWHRPGSLSRFLGTRAAVVINAVDIDWCEYCWSCGTPLLLIETQRSIKAPKKAAVTARLAALAGLDAYSVSYSVDEAGDCVRFLVRRIHPTSTVVEDFTAAGYAAWLLDHRRRHAVLSGACSEALTRVLQRTVAA